MIIKRFLLILLAACMLLGLCACKSEKKQDASESTAAAGSVVTPEKPAEGENNDAQPDDGKKTYTIRVVDEYGEPVVGAKLQMCKGDLCLAPKTTDAEGTAVYTAEEAAYKVQLNSVPENYVHVEGEWYFEDGSYELIISVVSAA